jgi:hypothetical protein
VITRFPAEQLMVAGIHYHTATGPLTATRETQSHKNIDYTDVDYGGAGLPGDPIRKPNGNGRNGNHRKAPAKPVKKTRSRK